MTTTPTLERLILAEMEKVRPYDPNRLQFYSRGLIDILKFDDVIYEIVSDRFFLGEKLSDASHDRDFKKLWTHHFLNRQIQMQTQEAFAARVTSTFMRFQQMLSTFYSNNDELLSGKRTNASKTEGDNAQKTRSGDATLPQNQTKLDLSSDVMEYADSITHSNTHGDSRSTTDQESQVYNAENMLSVPEAMDNILKVFDQRCFLQVFF